MEFLPKLFAKKISPYSSYAFLKLFIMLFAVGILGAVLTAVSQFLSEVVFFTGFAIVLVAMMGFASAKHYEEKTKLMSTNPIILRILASPLFNSLENFISVLSKTFFIFVFHLFLLFAVFAILFPFWARWYGS